MAGAVRRQLKISEEGSSVVSVLGASFLLSLSCDRLCSDFILVLIPLFHLLCLWLMLFLVLFVLVAPCLFQNFLDHDYEDAPIHETPFSKRTCKYKLNSSARER